MTLPTADANRTKYTLDEADLPTRWYNIQADATLPRAAPGAGFGYPSPHLLQVCRCRFAQAQYISASGVLQQDRGGG